MRNWMNGIRGVVLMIGLWVIGWGLGFGGVMELIDPDGKIQDVWPTLLAVPGFIGGIIFTAVLLLLNRGRRFDQISGAHFALAGVFAGLLLGLLTIPAKVGDVSPGAWGMIGIGMGLGLIAGIGSWVFCRLMIRRETISV